MAYVYFHYSSQQFKFMKDMEAKMGRSYKAGIVFNKGKKLVFTEKSNKKTSMYSDDKIVAEGEEANFKFTLPGGR